MGWIRVTLAARKAAGDVKLNLTDMNKSLNLILHSDDTRMPPFLSFSLTYLLCRSFPGRVLSVCVFVQLTWSWFGPRGRETSIVLRLAHLLLLALCPCFISDSLLFFSQIRSTAHMVVFIHLFSCHRLKWCWVCVSMCSELQAGGHFCTKPERYKERKKDRMRTRCSMRRPFCACLKGRIR